MNLGDKVKVSNISEEDAAIQSAIWRYLYTRESGAKRIVCQPNQDYKDNTLKGIDVWKFSVIVVGPTAFLKKASDIVVWFEANGYTASETGVWRNDQTGGQFGRNIFFLAGKQVPDADIPLYPVDLITLV